MNNGLLEKTHDTKDICTCQSDKCRIAFRYFANQFTGHVTHACRTSCCCSTAAAAAAADAHNRSLVSTVNDIAPVGPRGVERMEISDMGAH